MTKSSEAGSRRASIARRIREAREMAGLSQAQLAAILGLHRPAISEVEAGRRRVPAEELVELADVLGVSLDWLAARSGEEVLGARVQLAARELARLSGDDYNRLIRILTALKDAE